MPAFFDLTNDALRLWVTATGVDPDGQWSFRDFSVRQCNDWIRVAQDADPTGLTTYLYLRAIARDWVSGHTYDALSLIECPDDVQEEMVPLRALVEALDHPTLVAQATAFQEQVRAVAEDQGVLAHTAATIDDLAALGMIRLDALHAIRTLRRDTFARGPRRADHLRYNRRVLKFWNMNSLVRALEVQPEDGISLCMLRDPNVVEFSFFAFALRDGDVRAIWSDLPESSHPLQKYMSRSRARAGRFEERAAKFRFPYDLLDAKYADDGRTIVSDTSGTGVVRTNVEAVTIAELSDLKPDETLWALMMFDLLRHQPDQASELSCTGETVYLALGGSSQLALGSVEPLTRADVNSLAIDEQLARTDYRAHASNHSNVWMEERYADEVDETLYNLFGTPQEGLARSGTSEIEIQTKTREGRSLASLDPMTFGTATQMRDDRLWVARHNQAMRVQELANAEFKRRREKVWKWFVDAVQKNSTWFVDAACRATAPVEGVLLSTDTFSSDLVPSTVDLVQWQRIRKGDTPTSIRDGSWSHAPLYTPSNRVERRRYIGRGKWKNWETFPPKCLVSGEVASVWTMFSPRSPAMLQAMVGCAKLPDVLEHWFLDVPYNGNSILDRTDPMDSMVKNPWAELEFNVLVGLSLREFRRQCKARGIQHPEDFATPGTHGWSMWRHVPSVVEDEETEDEETEDEETDV